jgi:hypothetical protein
VGDNTTAKQLRSAFNANSFALFEGTYHNFLALYSSVSRHLERQATQQIENKKKTLPLAHPSVCRRYPQFCTLLAEQNSTELA